jgi:hypothetical protein
MLTFFGNAFYAAGMTTTIVLLKWYWQYLPRVFQLTAWLLISVNRWCVSVAYSCKSVLFSALTNRASLSSWVSQLNFLVRNHTIFSLVCFQRYHLVVLLNLYMAFCVHIWKQYMLYCYFSSMLLLLTLNSLIKAVKIWELLPCTQDRGSKAYCSRFSGG